MPTFATPAPVLLTVDIAAGAYVHVVATDRAESEVVVRPHRPERKADRRAADETQVELVDGRLTVWLRREGALPWVNTGTVDVAVTVPAGSALDVASGAGDVRCDGAFADVAARTGAGAVRVDRCANLRARSGAGAVTVESVAGVADVGTGSGAVRVSEAGAARVKSGNGAISLGTVAGEAQVKAANGDVRIDRAAGPVVARSAHGRVAVGELVRGTAALTSASGSIDIGIARGTAAWLDLHTSHGRVTNQLDVTGEPAPGSDVLEVRARTSSGDVTVRRAAERTLRSM